MSKYTRKDNVFFLYSPSNRLCFRLYDENGKIEYDVAVDGVVRYKKSPLGIVVGTSEESGEDYGVSNKIKNVFEEETKDRKFVVYGRCEKQVENSVRYLVEIEHGEITFHLEVKAFDEGVAFRYLFEREVGTFVFSEQTEFCLQDESRIYASFGCRNPDCNTALNGRDALCYECTYDEYDPSQKIIPTDYVKTMDYVTEERFFNCLLTPMTVLFSDGSYGAILEGNVVNYYGSTLRPFGNYKFGLNTRADGEQFQTFCVRNRVRTPYRILLFNRDLNGLYNNQTLNALVVRANGDFSFVKPGRSTWHWHAEAMAHCTYDPSYDLLKKYTKTAAKLGFEYNTIDAGWQNMQKQADGETLRGAAFVKKLCEEGKKYGVGQFVWGGYTSKYPLNEKKFDDKGERYYSTKEFIDLAASVGAVGAKIDFFRNEDDMIGGVNMYEDILEYSTHKKLMLNFHGATKPTGLSAKYPNEVSREAIRGMENYFYNSSNYSDIAYAFTTLTFVRGLAGHGDWTPFVTDGIGLAAVLCTDSPINTISALCEDLSELKSLEFLKSMPTSFDRTVVLKTSRFGKYLSMAKEKGGTWFAAAINHTGATYTDALQTREFLGEGRYFMELWYDSPEGLRKELRWHRGCGPQDVKIDLPNNRGYAVRFSKYVLSQYGGEIKAPVEIRTFDDSEIYYTLDGSDPNSSPTRVRYETPIEPKTSCLLRLSCMQDEKRIAEGAYRFNKIED